MSSFPLAVFAFNRPDHIRRTLQALAANTFAPETDLIVFCDGPRNEEEGERTKKVRDICKTTTGFRSLTVRERDHNLGLAGSIRSGVTEVLRDAEAVIVMEDDLLSHSSFLWFMNEALQRYHGDSRIMSISGYLPPAWRLGVRRSTLPDVWLSRRHMSFGWGTWKDRWASVIWDLPEKEGFSRDVKAWRTFANAGGEDLPWMLVEEIEGELNSWSIRFNYAHARSGCGALLPGSSYLKPIGFDGSGRHCLPNPLRWLESIRHARQQIEWPDVPQEDPDLNRVLSRSFSRHHRWAVRLGVTPPRAKEMAKALS